jgi:peptidoglycan hydrolase-like protein with peptidoglycan-binding domain
MSATYELPEEIASTLTNPALYEGDFGTAVVELQKLLNARGANLLVDGFFGPVTKAAVIHFQKHYGLVPDGAIGSIAWKELRRRKLPVRLDDICLLYSPQTLPHQAEALQWLQSQIPAKTLEEFLRRWQRQA